MTRAMHAGAVQRRGVALAGTVALAVILVLAGCTGRGAQGQNDYGNGGAGTGAVSSSMASTASQVGSVDRQVQNALGGLDTTENSATSADSMSQEGTTLP